MDGVCTLELETGSLHSTLLTPDRITGLDVPMFAKDADCRAPNWDDFPWPVDVPYRENQ